MKEDKSFYIFKLFSLIMKIDGLKNCGIKRMNAYGIKAAILLTLIYEQGVSQSMIVGRMAIAKQTINNIIMELYDDGYVEAITDESDKRLKILVLTEKGKQYSKDYLKKIIEFNSYVYDRLGEDKVRYLTKDFSELADILLEINKEVF